MTGFATRLSRRAAIGTSLALASRLGIARGQSATPAPAADPATAALAITERAMAEMDLRAVLLHVTTGDDTLVHDARGESLAGHPATPDMHVRNGAVGITYTATVLLRLVEQGVVALDEPLATWLPDLPDADAVTLRMLANMTAGYPDYVQNPALDAAVYADPFRAWTPEELIEIGLSSPRVFAPGENWDYSHTAYVILGLALEAATGDSLETLLHEHVLDRLDLADTASEQTAWMPAPVLHAVSAERRGALGIPPEIPFLEESTFWNPSWTIARGSVQYSTVADMARSFRGIGRGEILTEASMAELLTRDLLGFGEPLAGCPNCHTMNEVFVYGLGIWQSGGWILQNPLFGGYGGTVGYHPASDIAVAVANTFGPGSFDETGAYAVGNGSQAIFRDIASLLTPDDPPFTAH